MLMADYDELTLLVEVTGLPQQGVMRTSHSNFKVPYCSLARTLQLIRLRGGKIVRIHSPVSSLTTKTGEPPLPATEEPQPPSPETEESPSPEMVKPPSPKTGEPPSPLRVESKVPKQLNLFELIRRLLRKT